MKDTPKVYWCMIIGVQHEYTVNLGGGLSKKNKGRTMCPSPTSMVTNAVVGVNIVDYAKSDTFAVVVPSMYNINSL